MTESLFALCVRQELAQARGGHRSINSVHEGYAVLLEEVDEFWQEVKKKRKDRYPGRLIEELVQVGAMAQRIAEDCLFQPPGNEP